MKISTVFIRVMCALASVPVAAMAAAQSVALPEPLPPPELVANPTVSATLSLDRASAWPSQASEVVVLVEFQNTTNDLLRWHKPEWLPEGDVYPTRICLQRADGVRYLANGTGGDSRGLHLGGESTALLAPGGVDYSGSWLGWGAPATDKWIPVGTGAFDEESPWKPLEIGEYEVWLEFQDGSMLGGEAVQERMPEFGLYQSNRVHLSVVPEGTPLAQAPRLKQSPKTGRLLTHRGTGLVTAKALAGYGIISRADKQGIVLSRGDQQLQLPYSLPAATRGTSRVGPQAISIAGAKSPETCYVPLRHVAETLGFEVRFDARTRVYDLRPPVGRGRQSKGV